MVIHPKVSAGLFASYVTVCLLYAAGAYGWHIDGVLGGAIDGILTTLFAFWMPSGDGTNPPAPVPLPEIPAQPGDPHV
jgi:hypothetical protein